MEEKLSFAATDDSEVASTVPYGLSFTLGGRADVGGGIELVYLLKPSLDVQLDLGRIGPDQDVLSCKTRHQAGCQRALD